MANRLRSLASDHLPLDAVVVTNPTSWLANVGFTWVSEPEILRNNSSDGVLNFVSALMYSFVTCMKKSLILSKGHKYARFKYVINLIFPI